MSSARNMCKNIGKITSKNLNSEKSKEISKKLLDHAKQYATDAIKTASKRTIQSRK